MGIAVYMPCPISTCPMISVTRPSVPMRMNAFGAKTAAVSRAPAARQLHPTAAHRRRRRSRLEIPGATPDSWFASGRVLDGRADACIGATAANVARHRLVDIGVGRRGVLRQQRGGGHDLAGLAVAALHDLEVEPRLLDL